MFDSIEIIAGLLFAFLFFIIFLAARVKQWQLVFIFLIIAALPLMWAGLIRIHIPQTIIWMGMNIFAIIFIWQGAVGLLFKAQQNQVIALPEKIIGRYAALCNLLIGIAFASLIILARY